MNLTEDSLKNLAAYNEALKHLASVEKTCQETLQEAQTKYREALSALNQELLKQ